MLFTLLPIFFFIHSIIFTPIHSLILQRLSPFNETKPLVSYEPNEAKCYYYKQTLDHFNYMPESYIKFDQRYFIDFKYWGGANLSAPIFVYFGAESSLDDCGIGFMVDNAPTFKALLVCIEHRYYGKSMPFGQRREAFKNASTLGYFNSAQALADYGEVIIHIKETLQAQNSPVIVIGESYGGMLASWFRLKYPHLAIGALASSAPILSFDDITPSTAIYDVISRNFKEASKTCYKTIRNSWSEIDKIASQPNGLRILSERFNTCRPLKNSSELKEYLENTYGAAAQYDFPPDYPVSVICKGIDEASFGNKTIDKIYSGIARLSIGMTTCRDNSQFESQETLEGWAWQTCSEMVIPIALGNNSMFEPRPYHFKSFAEGCKKKFGVSPRPHWITSYYGGHSMKLVFKRFASNIIFSNGLKDPWSSGGILSNLSESLVAIYTVNGAHCLDISTYSSESDPRWLTEQRKKEVEIIQGWITQYYRDLD